MIRSLLFPRSPFLWIIFHILLGIGSAYSAVVLILWYYIVLVTSGVLLLNANKNLFPLLTGLIIYITSFELPARMAESHPYIPYEAGKYLLFLFLGFGIVRKFHKGALGFWLLLMLVPGVVYGLLQGTGRGGIVFNVLGPVNIALAVIYFWKQAITEKEFAGMLRLLLLPLITALAFTIVRTPDLNKVEFSLSALDVTTGGFGSNQVSTGFGLGLFLVFVFWINRWKLSEYRWLDIALMFGFAFQGFLTFSRGGMMGGVLGIIIVLFITSRSSATRFSTIRNNSLRFILPALLLIYIVFEVADNITGNQLSLRYAGETAGTLSGSKVKNLNTITSNRLVIFQDDVELWSRNPLLGAGVGRSSLERVNTRGFQAHTELSRLLSEHGAFGFVFILILFYIGFRIYKNNIDPGYKSILFALFIIAVFTSFHAAMRTYVTPLLIGVSLLSVYSVQNKPNPIND